MLTRLPVAAGLALGVAADAVLGDPARWHPVAGFGQAVGSLERRTYRDHRGSGALFTFAATTPVLALGAVAQRAVRSHPYLRTALTAVATWAVLGGTSLSRVGSSMGAELSADRTDAARQLLSSLCGRDPASLDAPGLARATVESIAENTSDAVVSPLFWGAVAGVPGLLGYRAINTLDAMVGHRSPRYARFGTASARLDDAANLVPARLTALLTLAAAPLVGGTTRGGWAAWRTDAAKHPSPNAGQCEAAAAGVLGVQLGGATTYGTRVEQRPTLGTGRAPEVSDIARAVRLSRAVSLASLAVCVAGTLLADRARNRS